MSNFADCLARKLLPFSGWTFHQIPRSADCSAMSPVEASYWTSDQRSNFVIWLARSLVQGSCWTWHRSSRFADCVARSHLQGSERTRHQNSSFLGFGGGCITNSNTPPSLQPLFGSWLPIWILPERIKIHERISMQHLNLLEHKCRTMLHSRPQCLAVSTFGEASAVNQDGGERALRLSLEAALKPSSALPVPEQEHPASICILHHSGIAHWFQSSPSHWLMALCSHQQWSTSAGFTSSHCELLGTLSQPPWHHRASPHRVLNLYRCGCWKLSRNQALNSLPKTNCSHTSECSLS